MNKLIASALVSSVLMLSGPVSASGGGGFNQGSFSQRNIDKLYEQGKALYKNGTASSGKVKYCVQTGSGLTKLSRKSVKAYKKGSAATFANNLYNCDQPDVRIAQLVSEDEGQAILHYLNKRFKLRLAGS